MNAPADGLRYADPGAISGATYDAITAWILAQLDSRVERDMVGRP